MNREQKVQVTNFSFGHSDLASNILTQTHRVSCCAKKASELMPGSGLAYNARKASEQGCICRLEDAIFNQQHEQAWT